MARRLPILLPLLLARCSGDGPAGEPPPDVESTDDDPVPVVDPTDAVFRPDHVLVVEVDMDPSDWEAMRLQTRDVIAMFEGEGCLDEPFGNPFTTFPASVTLDGETLAPVGIRKKGLIGSLSDLKPALKIDLQEVDPQLEWRGLEQLTLNNALSDPGLLRQCLAYDLFAKAGVPAPRCTFARVQVAGEELGVYVHLEEVDERFLRRHFEDADGELFEGTLSDFRDGWLGSFERETTGDASPLDAVAEALRAPDAELEEALASVVDLDAFFTFWAMEVLTGHLDGYASNANNFFVYAPPDGGLRLLPWGTDATFWRGDPLGYGVDSVYANGLLARRLYEGPATRARYHARLRQLLDSVWDEEAIAAEIDRMQTLLLGLEALAGDPEDLTAAIDEVRSFVRERRSTILEEIDDGQGPDWARELRDPPCLVPVGTAEGTFEATWGTVGAENPFGLGQGALDGELEGEPLVIGGVTATAGWDTDGSGEAVVQVIALLDDGLVAVAHLTVDPALFVPGAELELDLDRTGGALLWFDPADGSWGVWGYLLGGRLHLEQASTTDGAIVRGSFESEVVEAGF